MSGPAQLIGIDVGTSALKGVLVDESGAVIAQTSHTYPLLTPKPGWTEQAPEAWVRAALAALCDLTESNTFDGERLAGVGLSGQMHGTVFLDSDDNVIRPALLWNDQRTAAECKEIENAFGGTEALVAATGNLALTGFSAPKLLWLRNHEPANWRRVAKVLLPKDHVRFALTGEVAAEVTDGSGTLLMDVPNRTWSKETLTLLGIDESLLPPLLESTGVAGRITKEVAARTGIPEGTPVAAGAGDQAAGAVGTGNVSPGTVTVALGTSGVVFASAERYATDPLGRLHAFCHASPGLWHLMGVMLSAGGSLAWLRNAASGNGERVSFETLMEEARAVPTGTDGLLFHPYLTGERTPLNDPQAKGTFFGLTIGHGRGHLARAVVEGVIHGITDCFELIVEAGVAVERVVVTGGAAQEELWRQTLADALNREVTSLSVDEGPAFGAALLAGVSSGVFPDVVDACRRTVRFAGTVPPNAARHEVLAEAHARYRRLRERVSPLYTSGAESGGEW